MDLLPPIPALGRRTLVMGILNVTPDSFSGDGLLKQPDFAAAALGQAERMIADGAGILDIGGESTRPGYIPVSADEEIRRTAPVIEAIHARWPDLPISIDTMKPAVAAAALEAGACLINDISGTAVDPAMLSLAAARGVYLVVMHNRSEGGAVTSDARLGNAYQAPVYNDIVADVLRDLRGMAGRAQAAGIAPERIILDPGLGFGKTVAQNLRLMDELDKIKTVGFPVLAGPSRKSFIGRVLDAPPDDRLEGTAAAVTICTLRGADILRVHDVKAMARVVKMARAIEGRN
jgi:dihydropteroate synthase